MQSALSAAQICYIAVLYCTIRLLKTDQTIAAKLVVVPAVAFVYVYTVKLLQEVTDRAMQPFVPAVSFTRPTAFSLMYRFYVQP